MCSVGNFVLFTVVKVFAYWFRFNIGLTKCQRICFEEAVEVRITVIM